MIPAQPGWLQVTCAGGDDEEFWHETEPVIGWLVSVDGNPVPIVASVAPGESSVAYYFLVTPAGSGATRQVFG